MIYTVLYLYKGSTFLSIKYNSQGYASHCISEGFSYICCTFLSYDSTCCSTVGFTGTFKSVLYFDENDVQQREKVCGPFGMMWIFLSFY